MPFEKYDHIETIKNTNQLKQFCDHLRHDEKSDFITIDTEFMRRTTYWPQLCLIQVAGSKDLAVIDPLADTLDLAPFYELMKAPHLIKVFHSARQDLEIFFHAIGSLPHPIFDTQVAAMVCGYGDSIGYSNLVEELLKVGVDKTQRFTDWSVRPLKQQQLKYAIQDVTHLRQVYEILKEKLAKEGRSTWIKNEMTVLEDPKTYEINEMEVWQKIKTRSNEPRFLARVQYLAAAREDLSIKHDRPRSRIATDQAILELAADPAEDIDTIMARKSLSLSKETGKAFVDALKHADRILLEQCPQKEEKRRKPKDVVLLEFLQLWLKQVAYEHQVAPKLIASSEDLDLLIRGNNRDIPVLHGWRYKIFGQNAQLLISGEKSIRYQKGKLVLI